jgi:hypothetical protein
MRFAVLTVLVVVVGCGSTTPYRPYKGEQRPEQVVREDPIEAAVKLKYEIPHEVNEDTWDISVARRENGIVLRDTLWNEDDNGKLHRHNPWNTYATDMNHTLGAGTIREAPRPQPKNEAMLKKSEQMGEGGGGGGGEGGEKGDKGADKGDKGDKGADKGDKPAEGGEKKE